MGGSFHGKLAMSVTRLANPLRSPSVNFSTRKERMADADVSLEASPVRSEGGNTWLDRLESVWAKGTRPGKQPHNYGKWPFIVDFPIKNGDL